MALESTITNWSGKFGEEYTKRNQYDWRKRIPVFKSILKGIKVKTALEIGTNCGFNLSVLESLKVGVMGIEPNSYARKEATGRGFLVFPGTANSIPFPPNSFDLVFTCGVLIHVPPKELQASLKEIIRVSSKYVLAIEYESSEETMKVYRGKRDMLWKRPYGKLYKKLGLKLVSEGKTTIDRCHFWLFEK